MFNAFGAVAVAPRLSDGSREAVSRSILRIASQSVQMLAAHVFVGHGGPMVLETTLHLFR